MLLLLLKIRESDSGGVVVIVNGRVKVGVKVRIVDTKNREEEWRENEERRERKGRRENEEGRKEGTKEGREM